MKTRFHFVHWLHFLKLVFAFIYLAVALILFAPQLLAQSASFILGTATVVEPPTAGIDSVVLAAPSTASPWTATANVTWLHITSTNQNGDGSANVIFAYDGNSGATRQGTITIAGLSLNVTQTGSSYVPASPVTVLVSNNSILPSGIALDTFGNVYVADPENNAIEEWIAGSNTMVSLIKSGLDGPLGVAVDVASNIYIAEGTDSAILEWIAASNMLITLIPSGDDTGMGYLSSPYNLVLDNEGDLYIADTGDNQIWMWVPGYPGYGFGPIFSWQYNIYGVSVDVEDNIYFTMFEGIWKIQAGDFNYSEIAPAEDPVGIAVDGGGNVYYAAGTINEWQAADGADSHRSVLWAEQSLRCGGG